MRFTKNDSLDRWERPATLLGAKFRLSVLAEYPKEAIEEVASAGLARLERAWLSIQQNVVASLLSDYNESWADPEAGLPVLQPEDFLSKLVLTAVDVLEEGDLSLYLSDSGLFGGHSVKAYVCGDGEILTPTLVG